MDNFGFYASCRVNPIVHENDRDFIFTKRQSNAHAQGFGISSRVKRKISYNYSDLLHDSPNERNLSTSLAMHAWSYWLPNNMPSTLATFLCSALNAHIVMSTPLSTNATNSFRFTLKT